MSELIKYRRIADAANARRRSAVDAVASERKALESAIAEHKDWLECQIIVQQTAAGVQAAAHAQIAKIVNRILAAIYDDPYEFRINFERRRGKTEADLTFVRDGNVIDDPLTAAGGGVVACAAFGLRLASLVLQRPRPRPTMILDEPFGGLDRPALVRMRSLIETLASEMGFQFIIVTHSTVLRAGTVITLGDE